MSLSAIKSPNATDPRVALQRTAGGSVWIEPDRHGAGIRCRINDANGEPVVETSKFAIAGGPAAASSADGAAPLTLTRIDDDRIGIHLNAPGFDGETIEVRSDAGNDAGISVMAYDRHGDDLGETYADAEELAGEPDDEAEAVPSASTG